MPVHSKVASTPLPSLSTALVRIAAVSFATASFSSIVSGRFAGGGTTILVLIEDSQLKAPIVRSNHLGANP
jgi:hypothetical protein